MPRRVHEASGNRVSAHSRPSRRAPNTLRETSVQGSGSAGGVTQWPPPVRPAGEQARATPTEPIPLQAPTRVLEGEAGPPRISKKKEGELPSQKAHSVPSPRLGAFWVVKGPRG